MTYYFLIWCNAINEWKTIISRDAERNNFNIQKILYWSIIISMLIYIADQKNSAVSQSLRVLRFHCATPCRATSVRTIKRWLTGGYNAKSKNQNTLISDTWRGSHAGNKTACTPPRVACIDVFTASGGQQSRWRLKMLDYLYCLLFVYFLNKKYSVLYIEYASNLFGKY